ncbi:MAG: hypothetical protein WCT18_04705 [Patescibacteria group bacterium]
MIPNIYLDIDGVLLKGREPSFFAKEFLAYVLEQYPDCVFWLTTRCKGDADILIRHMSQFFDTETLDLMKKIKPTNWNVAKTDAIDFSKPFLWFDDTCFDFEKAILQKHEALENWVEIDLAKNPNVLKDFLTDFPLPV